MRSDKNQLYRQEHLIAAASEYVDVLCHHVDNRRVGSPGNRAATDYVAAKLASFGWEVEAPAFDCLDWAEDGADLTVAGHAYAVQPSPYSLGCQVEAPVAVISTLAELEAVDARGQVLLVNGALAQEQLMPKRFPFYNPEEHQRIIALLEAKAPAAIVAATGRNPESAGAVYPFPLIEDGDFHIPSVYTTEEEGERLAQQAGRHAALTSRATRIPATACNVVGHRGDRQGQRVVVCAHVDAKIATPGALDNAAGVTMLLLLAELLADYTGRLHVELLAVNGEDYYAASGEVDYLERNAGRLGDIVLAVNIDAAGYHEGGTAYSLYACPDALAATVHEAFAGASGMLEGEPWFQSDHMVFVQNGVPAVAITSERYVELATTITHTTQDTPGRVDVAKLAGLAASLRELVLALDRAEPR